MNVRLSLRLPAELKQQLDGWQIENGVLNQSDAVRLLLGQALNTTPDVVVRIPGIANRAECSHLLGKMRSLHAKLHYLYNRVTAPRPIDPDDLELVALVDGWRATSAEALTQLKEFLLIVPEIRKMILGLSERDLQDLRLARKVLQSRINAVAKSQEKTSDVTLKKQAEDYINSLRRVLEKSNLGEHASE